MKAPSIDISFIEKGISAVTRSERGIVMFMGKRCIATIFEKPITVVTESDIPEALQENTVEQVKLAMQVTPMHLKKCLYIVWISAQAEKQAYIQIQRKQK